MGKGEIPLYIVERIFGFYWKTQVTYMTKVFLSEHVINKQKGGKKTERRTRKLIYEK